MSSFAGTPFPGLATRVVLGDQVASHLMSHQKLLSINQRALASSMASANNKNTSMIDRSNFFTLLPRFFRQPLIDIDLSCPCLASLPGTDSLLVC